MQETIEMTLLGMVCRSVRSHLAAIDYITFLYAKTFLIVSPKRIVTPPQKFYQH